MRRAAISFAILAALPAPAPAQQCPPGKTCVVAQPYAYSPLCPRQTNVAPTSSTALTMPTGFIDLSGVCNTDASVRPIYATVCAKTATINVSTDPSNPPTSSNGNALAVGACIPLLGYGMIKAFRAFSSTGTFDAEFFQ